MPSPFADIIACPPQTPDPPAPEPAEGIERRRTAWVWNHMPDDDPQTIYFDDKGRIQWRCMHCSRKYLESGGTRIIQRHLRCIHNIQGTSPRQEKKNRARGAIEKAMDSAARHAGHKRRRLEEEDEEPVPEKYALDPHVLELLFVRWFAKGAVPLSTIECEEFRALLAYINRDIDTWLPSSAETIKKWVLRTFNDQKPWKKDELQAAKSKIHITCDLATTPNGLAIMAICAHFVAESGELKKMTLALKEVDGMHTADNLATVLFDAIEEWGFMSKLGYFVMDNDVTNDAMLREFSVRKLIFILPALTAYLIR